MSEAWARLRQQVRSVRSWLIKSVQDNPLATLLALLVLGWLTWAIWQTVLAKRLGFDKRTLWEWLDLLIIPILLVIAVWYFDRRERISDRDAAKDRVDHEQSLTDQRVKGDREIAINRANQHTLETCMEFIADQLLNPVASTGSTVTRTAIVRARVLEALDILAEDRNRRDQLLRFLRETRLLSSNPPPACKSLFRDLTLPGVSLKGDELGDVDFTHSKLTSVCLSQAKLAGASFEGATLVDVDFQGAVLEDACFEGAKARNVNFGKAILNRARMDGFITLGKTDFTSATLTNATLMKADLTQAILERANLCDAILTGAELQSTNLQTTQLQRARLNGADLGDATLTAALLKEAVLDFAKLHKAKLDDPLDLLERWRHVWEIQGRVPDEEQNERQSESSPSDSLLGLLELEAAPHESTYRGKDLSNADLNDVDLRGYDLTGTSFTGSDLRNAHFENAILMGANLTGCDLRDAKFDGADMDDCDLTDAKFDPQQFAGARNVPRAARQRTGATAAQGA